jgi:hypothetical protein
MNKKNYLKELNEIKSIVNKIKKININENVRFEDDEDFNDLYAGEEEQPIEEPVQEPEVPAEEPVQEPEQCAGGECNLDKKSTEEIGMEELDKMGEVDQIRKITLNGMTKLADHPEDPQFQALLKIFQICNKSVDTKEEGGEK